MTKYKELNQKLQQEIKKSALTSNPNSNFKLHLNTIAEIFLGEEGLTPRDICLWEVEEYFYNKIDNAASIYNLGNVSHLDYMGSYSHSWREELISGGYLPFEYKRAGQANLRLAVKI